MTEHRPCPFCGSNNLVIEDGCLYIKCINCGAFGPSADVDPFSSLQKEIITSKIWTAWDTRSWGWV